MIKWLKYLWNESGKRIFLIRFIVPALGLFFTFGFLGHLYMVNFKLTDLNKINGKISSIGVVKENSFGRGATYHFLKIRLHGNKNSFRVHDHFQHYFNELLENISSGDKVTLYHRNRLQTILSWGKKNDLFQTEKNEETLFELKWMLNYKRNQMKTFAIFGLICWIAYGYYLIEKDQEIN